MSRRSPCHEWIVLSPRDLRELTQATTRQAASDAPDADVPAGCAVWEFPRGVDLALVTESAEHRYEEPDFVGTLVANGDDTLTVDVVRGVARYDDRILYFVDGRGAFELVARDVRWEQGAVRVRLVLRGL